MERKNIRFNITVKNKIGSELGRFQIEASSKSEALEKAKDCIRQPYREKVFFRSAKRKGIKMNKAQRIIFRIVLILVGLLVALVVVIESRILMIESQLSIGHFFILFFALVLIAAGLTFLFITRSR